MFKDDEGPQGGGRGYNLATQGMLVVSELLSILTVVADIYT